MASLCGTRVLTVAEPRMQFRIGTPDDLDALIPPSRKALLTSFEGAVQDRISAVRVVEGRREAEFFRLAGGTSMVGFEDSGRQWHAEPCLATPQGDLDAVIEMIEKVQPWW